MDVCVGQVISSLELLESFCSLPITNGDCSGLVITRLWILRGIWEPISLPREIVHLNLGSILNWAIAYCRVLQHSHYRHMNN